MSFNPRRCLPDNYRTLSMRDIQSPGGDNTPLAPNQAASLLHAYAFGGDGRAGRAILGNESCVRAMPVPLSIQAIYEVLECSLNEALNNAHGRAEMKAIGALWHELDDPAILRSIVSAHRSRFYAWKHGESLGPIHVLVIEGDIEAIGQQAAGGASFNSAQGTCSPLHLAAQDANATMVAALLAGGSTIDALDSAGRTPLHYSAEVGGEAALAALLERGAQANIQDNDGMTALMLAAMHGRQTCVSLLLPVSDHSLSNRRGGGAVELSRNEWPELAAEIEAFALAERERLSIASVASGPAAIPQPSRAL